MQSSLFPELKQIQSQIDSIQTLLQEAIDIRENNYEKLVEEFPGLPRDKNATLETCFLDEGYNPHECNALW
jgi:hypothetical protein